MIDTGKSSRARHRQLEFVISGRKSDTIKNRLAALLARQEETMSIIDKALEANRNYAKSYDPTLGKRPAPKIVVVTCMDPRLSDLPGILGLPQADFGSASDLSGSLRFVGLMLGIRSRRTMRWSRIRYRGAASNGYAAAHSG
jgi:hypothetical protein